MGIFGSTFEAVATLLVLGLVGFWLVNRRVLAEAALGALSALALDVALPSLVFTNIVSNFRPANFPGWWLLPLWWLGFTVFSGILTLLVVWTAAAPTRREFAVGLFYPNAIFVPLVIITEMKGGDSPLLTQLFLLTIFFPAALFNTVQCFFRGPCLPRNWRRVLNAVTLATVAGILGVYAGLPARIPRFVISGLTFMGHMTTPLLMIVLGGSIYLDSRGMGSARWGEVAKFVLIKNFFFPVAAIAALKVVPAPPDVVFLLLLQAAVPPVTALPALTAREGGNRGFVSQCLAASFFVSLLSIPLMLWLLERCCAFR